MILDSYTLGDNTLNIPSVDGALSMLEPEQTPFTSMVKKPSDVNNTFHEKTADRLRPARTTGTPEGYAGQRGSNKATQRARFGAYVQRFMDEFAVTDVQQMIAQKGGNYAVTDELGHAQAKCLRELKRDIEATCLSENECHGGDEEDMKLRGAYKWLMATQTPQLPDSVLCPAGQYLTSVTQIAEHGDNSLNQLLKLLAAQGGNSGEYHFFAGNDYIEDIDLFTRQIQQGTPAEARYTVNENGKAVDITMMVASFQTSFGRVVKHPDQFLRINDAGIGKTDSGLLLDMQYWELAWLNPLGIAERWENAGGSGGVYRGIAGLFCTMPRGNAAIINA